MEIFDKTTLENLIKLYYEKHHAINHADLQKLIDMKHEHPEIFVAENDAKIKKIIENAKEFKKTHRYKQLKQLDVKSKLTLIKNDPES